MSTRFSELLPLAALSIEYRSSQFNMVLIAYACMFLKAVASIPFNHFCVFKYVDSKSPLHFAYPGLYM